MSALIRNILKVTVYALSICCAGALTATIKWGELNAFTTTFAIIVIALVATPGLTLARQTVWRHEHKECLRHAQELHRTIHSMSRCGITHLLPLDIPGNSPHTMRVIIRTRECPELGPVAELERVYWHDPNGTTFIITPEGVTVDGRPAAGTQLAELTAFIQTASPRMPAPVR